MKSRPVLSRDPELDNVVPMALWGDHGRTHGDEKLALLTFCGALTRGSTWDRVFVITGVPGYWRLPGTLGTIFKAAAWSFERTLAG